MHTDKKLKIGRISYSNLFPIFRTLELQADCSAYDFVDGVPSALNRMIREGRIDVSPSSSIEYLRHRDKYRLLEGHSISSFGAVGSVLLFSERPLEALEGMKALTSTQSETSVAMLRIILRVFYEIDCIMVPTSFPPGKSPDSHNACLLIGDEAMQEALKWPAKNIYDLGDLWYRHTGLPAVFALWIVNPACLSEKSQLLEKFLSDLDLAKKAALRSLPTLAASSGLATVLPPDDIVAYWRGISYDFGPDHIKSLELFGRYAERFGLLKD